MLILGTELGLRANCKVPQGSDMPRAPWSSFHENLNSNTGPAGWFGSQGFILFYHWLDNLNNTCGISFNFDDGETPQQEASAGIFEETDQEGNAVLITNKILHKLFVKEFKVVSETGR